jgi:serine/threonine-protein kinase
MATVYRAVDTRLGRTVAVKVLHPEYARDRAFLQRFQQEAEFAASLGAHPNIVDIYDIGQDDDLHYIVMEFIDGAVLKELIERRRRFSVPEAFALGQQVASALDFAHKRGLIHRDVKPQNILITDDGQAKVTDFGIARSVTTSQLTRTGMVIGTVHYFSPEQAQGAPLAAQSDIYSLGVILYEMLTGHLPFDAENAIGVAMQHVHSPPPSPLDYNPDLPPRAVSTLMRALEKNPADRYRDAGEFAAALAAGAGAQPSGTTIVSPIVPAPRQPTAEFRPVPPPPARQERVIATPRRTAVVEEEPAANRTVWLTLLGLLLVLAVAGGVFLFTSNALNGQSAQSTVTPAPTAKPTRTPTPKPKPTKAPTIAPTVPVLVPTATFVPSTSTPRPRPTSTPKPRPTSTPKPVPTVIPFTPTPLPLPQVSNTPSG